ncbi:BA14K family protein [Microvirga solisilvae]|uniref:BA14K family protein n=1 Tax=Microvirga solisilvae TaxID=2919498 RepID=UPI001FAEDE6C|nr:BA14K family protein [Microvirga solisilvae]
MRKLYAILGSAGILGATLLGSSLPAQAEPTLESIRPQLERAYPNEGYTQYYRRRHYHDRHYYHRRGNGDALAAGAVGLAAGALIGAAIASQAQAQAAPPPPPGTVDPQMAAYCARKYRSYDPATGTFMANNGMRYVCTYP